MPWCMSIYLVLFQNTQSWFRCQDKFLLSSFWSYNMILCVYTDNTQLKWGSLESRTPPVLLIALIQSGQRASMLIHRGLFWYTRTLLRSLELNTLVIQSQNSAQGVRHEAQYVYIKKTDNKNHLWSITTAL